MPPKKKVKKKKKIVKEHKTIPKIDIIDEFYQYITKVQIEKEIVIVTINNFDLVPVIENIMRDCSLEFERQEFSKGMRYKIRPNFDEVPIDVDIDELKDEFLEEGQLF